MRTLLVLTAGQTDVQLVEGGERSEFDKNQSASLHDEIERREGEWRLVEAPGAKKSKAVGSLPEHRFDLCTPKLDAVMRHVKESQIQLTSTLILGTRRDADWERSDPRYAGAILALRLRQYGVSDVQQVPFLTGKESLEGSAPEEAFIRHEAVERIDRGVREAITNLNPDKILVATTGGFPAVNNLVYEIVRFYAPSGAEVKPLKAPKGRKSDDKVETAVSQSIEPAVSYQVRRHALELIEDGNLLGAWGAVRDLDHDEIQRQWTRVVEWLANFAASLPMPAECDIDVLKNQRMSVRAALRAELALRAGDIPRAVHGTVAFFEAALWDHLKARVTRHDDPKKRRYYKMDPPPDAKLVRDGGNEDQKRPFEVADETNGSLWFKIYDDGFCGERLAIHYLKQEALLRLGQAVSKVRYLRNDVAHNEPTPELMSEARDKMIAESLWSEDDGFLAQPLVRDVLRDLGEQDSDNLCTDLISDVRSRLLGTFTS